VHPETAFEICGVLGDSSKLCLGFAHSAAEFQNGRGMRARHLAILASMPYSCVWDRNKLRGLPMTTSMYPGSARTLV
jgi:hypothetical protein